MSCYHPLQAIRLPRLIEKKDKSGFYQDTMIRSGMDAPLDPYQLTIKSTGEVIDVHPFKIPCGRCLGCRLDYAKAWANRMTLESINMNEVYKVALQSSYLIDLRWQANEVEYEPWFITFTYDEYHLHSECKGRVNEDGSQHSTLVMEHFQDFMKRLRIHLYRKYGYEGTVRYYYAGEYGDTTARPHYHAIFWNLPLYKLRQYAKTALGDILYNDQDITDLWGKGHVVIAKANWNTCGYTARYVMKKQGMTASEQCELFDNIGIRAPYVRMSNRSGGIGLEFYERHKEEIYMRDQIVLPAKRKGETFKIKPPHIFDTKYAEAFPNELIKIKQARFEQVRIAESNLLKLTNLDPIEYSIGCEEKKKKEISSLKRRL